MTNPVFLGSTEAIAGLSRGDSYLLEGEEGHHAAVVQRLDAGEFLDLVDGSTGLRLTCLVQETNRDSVLLKITRRVVEPESCPRLVLVQALAKGDRSEQAIESATELGVDELRPWQAARSIVQWRGEKATRGVAKWRNVVRAAAKQARRTTVPDVGELVVTGKSGGLTSLVEPVVAAGGRVLVLHEEAEFALTSLEPWKGHDAAEKCPEVWLIVGPEGGFSEEERTDLRDSGAQEVRLGSTVLRSSSAGPAALAVLLVQLGRW